MAIRAVIWDLGGVLVRTENLAPRTQLAARLGMSRTELERIVFAGEWSDRAARGEISAAELWQSVCMRLKWPLEDSVSLQQAFWGGDKLDAELVDYIRSLRHLYCTALLSNAFSDLRSALERWAIVDAFDELIISAEVGLMKPDPLIFQLALERLQVASAEAVFIDDLYLNVRAAQAAGLHAIKFLDPLQVRADLRHLLNHS
jgi:epoxide hydrolase-like predicted phosphatase